MDNLSEILEVIEAGLKNNPTKVWNFSKMLAQNLEKDNDHKSAKRIITVLNRNKNLPLTPKSISLESKLPVDTESRLPLAEIERFEESEIFLSLSKNRMQQVDEYISILNKRDDLLKHGIKAHRNLLLSGAPGTGKTQTAKYIASKVGLPLICVRIDGLISSFLGSTSKNIRNLFDFVNQTPCLLFLDEFDAIAKMRDDSNELGELKRVVNTLLQNIDGINQNKSIIAATNHRHLLDSAVWRRFDYKIYLDSPAKRERELLINNYLRKYRNNIDSVDKLYIMTKGLNGAEIEHLCEIIKTDIALNDKSKITIKDLFDYFIRYKQTLNIDGYETEISNDEEKVIIARSLRKENQKDFSYRTLSKMLGKSLSNTHRVIKMGNEDE